MATQILSAGPSYIQIGVGALGALQHLGWTESGVEIEFNAAQEDVITDLGGPRIGTDVQFLGLEAVITADLIKYDETVLSKALARLNGETQGQVAPGALGSLLLGQGFSHRLLVACPYQTITAFSNQQSFYNFPTAYLLDAQRTKLSTTVKKFRVQWRALVNFSLSGGMSYGNLFNNDSTGLATID